MGTSSENNPSSQQPILNNREADEISSMRAEAQRLSTFSSWRHNDKVEARKIAKAGFFHTGNDSEVKCLWCGTVLNQWDYGDQVMARHRSANPDCPFIRNISDNVPLLNEQQITSQSESEDNNDQVESPDENDMPMETPDEQIDIAGPTATVTTSTNRLNQPEMLIGIEGERSVNLDNYRSEAARLQTYTGWPNRFLQPADLANAGFIYTGRNDLVQCVFCGQYVGNWDPEDFPITEHRSLFPECPFVQGFEVGNVPILPYQQSQPNLFNGVDQSSSSRSSTPTQSSEDHSGARGYDDTGIRPRRDAHSGPEKGPNVVRFIDEGAKHNDESVGIIRHSGPANSKYSGLESRLRSFRDWPPALKQEPQQLAEAGFYYIGLSDQTKCFYCDGGLRNWQPDDDPWTEHSRWFSKCGFVRLVKGDEFIAKCLAERPPDPVSGGGQISRDSQKPVTDEEVKNLMTSPVAQQVLSMGVDQSRIKMALRKQLQEKGTNFTSANQLAMAAMGAHAEQEDRVHTENRLSQPVFPSNFSAESQQPSTSSVNVPQGSSSSTSATDQIPPTEATGERSASAPGSVAGSEVEDSTTSATNATQNLVLNDGSDLENENRRLKEARTCKICMDNEIGVVFLPCGHLICCVQCAPALKDCPLCRTSIHGTVKTYMS